ncbi:MAG: CDP-alcohol phosphatidyltransferase family protein [Anaerolineae bacterium]|nr:CDP-alcohol phosphatidyltransferase family protein [Anaerolineae bacterium]
MKKTLPSLLTFLSLVSSFSAIILAIREAFVFAGLLILAGNILDTLDGEVARRLGVTSAFGLQLDSLVDAVTFGVAPGVLTYQYLHYVGFNAVLSWATCVLYLVAGVFRLARFNLLPPKDSFRDSLGLTISTSGAVVVFAVLANYTNDDLLLPAVVYPLLMIALALLMCSRIRFPSIAAILQWRRTCLTVLSVVAILSILLSPPLVILGLVAFYILFGLARAAYQSIPARTRS